MLTAYDILTTDFGKSSEEKFEKLNNLSKAILSIKNKTFEFQSDNNLDVKIIEQVNPLNLSPKVKFDYTGSLTNAMDRISLGEPITVVVVKRNLHIIGYGIALRNETETEIEIIDIDIYSRRSSGFCEALIIDGLKFSVGVAHLVVLKILSSCPHPFRVDSTHASSRYIFKSLGFQPDKAMSNPNILIK